ncbi:unnamed protein product [Dibothriocephalus latus]|uniref:Uncharacterized protein n=1 Tax=Dibothriocephalus latus TaxID=60516 RepID=A0A3P6PDR5_DIBLA|nr:unnamed protein product [Dibothriocephalus latus]
MPSFLFSVGLNKFARLARSVTRNRTLLQQHQQQQQQVPSTSQTPVIPTITTTASREFDHTAAHGTAHTPTHEPGSAFFAGVDAEAGLFGKALESRQDVEKVET